MTLTCFLLGLAYAGRIALPSDTKSCSLWNQNELNLTRVGSSIGRIRETWPLPPTSWPVEFFMPSSTPTHSNQIQSSVRTSTIRRSYLQCFLNIHSQTCQSQKCITPARVGYNAPLKPRNYFCSCIYPTRLHCASHLCQPPLPLLVCHSFTMYSSLTQSIQ